MMEIALAIGGPVGALFLGWFMRELVRHVKALHEIVEKQTQNGNRNDPPTIMDLLGELQKGQQRIEELLQSMKDMD